MNADSVHRRSIYLSLIIVLGVITTATLFNSFGAVLIALGVIFLVMETPRRERNEFKHSENYLIDSKN